MGLFDGKPIEPQEIAERVSVNLCELCLINEHGYCGPFECGCKSCHGDGHQYEPEERE
jgi:hypothetical protein